MANFSSSASENVPLTDRINQGVSDQLNEMVCNNAPQPDPTVHLREYQYVSQFAQDSTGIMVFVAGTLTDPDGQAVSVTFYDINGNPQWTETATRESVGAYQITFTPQQTSTPGYYSLVWSFLINTVFMSTTTWVQVGATNPAYDVLPVEMKSIVQEAWLRFADMFDSPQGGPHLQVYFQTNFSMGRIAQLLTIAVGFLNTMAQPYANFTLGGAGEFPFQQWGPLLGEALYIECLKHLIRSYVEQPMPQGITVSRQDRRDYMDRWTTILNMEQQMFKSQLDVFKISMMGLSRPRVLVAGGVFGQFSPTRLPGSAAARPHYAYRYF